MKKVFFFFNRQSSPISNKVNTYVYNSFPELNAIATIQIITSISEKIRKVVARAYLCSMYSARHANLESKEKKEVPRASH